MRFPQIHIATSVVNRIMKLRRAIPPTVIPTLPPSVPDPSQAGAALDAKLAQGPEPIAAPEGAEEAIGVAAATGDTAAAAVGGLAAIEALGNG